jgi:hypothetical protein
MADSTRLGTVTGRIALKTDTFASARAKITQQTKVIITANTDTAKSSEDASKRISKGFDKARESAGRLAKSSEQSGTQISAAFDKVLGAFDKLEKKSKSTSKQVKTDFEATVPAVKRMQDALERLNHTTEQTAKSQRINKFLTDVAGGAFKVTKEADKAAGSLERLKAATERNRQFQANESMLDRAIAGNNVIRPKPVTGLFAGSRTAGAAPDLSGLRQELNATNFDRLKASAKDAAASIQASFEKVGQKIRAGLTQAVDGVRTRLEQAKASFKAFEGTRLGKLQSGLGLIEEKIRGISAVAAGFAAGGLLASNSIYRTERQFAALLGSQEKATKEMAKLRKFADEMNAPFTQVLEAATQLTPIAKRSGAEFNKLLLITQKLAMIDPAQGITGSRIALSELISGDVTSIFRRFELGISRDEFRQIVDDAGGDVNVLLESLDKLLDKTGITTKAMKEMADPFALLGDEAKQAADAAFRPFLMDVLIPFVKELTTFLRDLRETNPEMLKFGAGLTLAVAAGAPLLKLITSLIGGFKALKAASVGLNLAQGLKTGKGAGGAIGKALAVGGGVIAGAGIAQGLANAGVRSGDLGRIASKESGGGGENVMDVLGERIKQIFVILVDQFLHFGHTLAKVALFIWNAGDQIVNIFKLIGSFVREFGATLQSVVGDLLVGISQLIAKIPGAEGMAIGILQAGGDLQRRGMIEKDAALDQRGAAAARLAQGLEVPQSELDRVEANFNALRENVIGGLVGFLFPVEQKAEEVAGDLEDAGETVAAAIGDTPEFIAEQQAEIADAYKTYIEDIKKIDEEKNSALLKANQDFAAEQVKIAQDMANAERKALEDLIKDRDKLLLDFNRDGDKAERERQRDELENMIEFQRKERDDAQAHADKLVDIQKKSQVRQQELLLNLDFKGLFELQQTTNAELEGANQSFAEQRRERLTALDDEKSDMARAFAAEREERQIAFEQALYDRSIAYHAEQADIARQNTEKLAQARQQYTAELAQIQQKHQMELSLRQQAANQEFQFLVMSEKQRTDFLLQEQNRYLQGAAALFSKMGIKAPTSMQSQPLTSSQQQTVQKAMQGAQTIGQNILNSPAVQAISNFLNPVKRGVGGGLGAGQTAIVNEGYREQMELFHAGGRTYQLAGGAGLFTPFKSGQVDPGASGAPNISVNVNVTPSAGMDEAALAREVARQVQEQLTGILQQIGAL